MAISGLWLALQLARNSVFFFLFFLCCRATRRDVRRFCIAKCTHFAALGSVSMQSAAHSVDDIDFTLYTTCTLLAVAFVVLHTNTHRLLVVSLRLTWATKRTRRAALHVLLNSGLRLLFGIARCSGASRAAAAAAAAPVQQPIERMLCVCVCPISVGCARRYDCRDGSHDKRSSILDATSFDFDKRAKFFLRFFFFITLLSATNFALH